VESVPKKKKRLRWERFAERGEGWNERVGVTVGIVLAIAISGATDIKERIIVLAPPHVR